MRGFAGAGEKGERAGQDRARRPIHVNFDHGAARRHGASMIQTVDLAALRDYLLESLAITRATRFHFPASFLRLDLERADLDGSRVSMPRGSHNTDHDGNVNVGAIAILADIASGVAMRKHFTETSRMATATLTLQFNGEPLDGDITVSSVYQGPVSGLRAVQGSCCGEICVGERLVGRVGATFVNPPIPAGITFNPLKTGKMRAAALLTGLDDLNAEERQIYERALRAARAVNSAANRSRHPPRSFIQEFWEQRARKTRAGRAGGVINHAPHAYNRVRHLQGGVLFGAAAASALALVSPGTRLVSANAWFLRPGIGALKVRSSTLQEGRNISVVRTEVLGANGVHVLEMVSSHARKAG